MRALPPTFIPYAPTAPSGAIPAVAPTLYVSDSLGSWSTLADGLPTSLPPRPSPPRPTPTLTDRKIDAIVAELAIRTHKACKARPKKANADEPDRLADFPSLFRQQLRCGGLAAADQTWRRMQASGVKPNEDTYCLLINGCIEAEKFVRIPCHLRAMWTAGYRLDVVYCNHLLRICAKQDPVQVDTALAIFAAMAQFDLRADVVSHTSLIHALGRAGRPQQCIQRFADMQMAGVQPDKHSYGALMDALRKNGRPRDALSIHQKMLAAGEGSNAVIDNTLLQSLIDLGDMSAVQQLWQKMLQRGAAGSVTCTVVLGALNSRGLLGPAQDVLSVAARRQITLRLRQVMPILSGAPRRDLDKTLAVARRTLSPPDFRQAERLLLRPLRR